MSAPEPLIVGEAMVSGGGDLRWRVRSISLASVPGLAVTEHTKLAGSWVVTHLASGLRLGDLTAPWREALRTMRRVGPAVDWTIDTEPLAEVLRGMDFKLHQEPGWRREDEVKTRENSPSLCA